MTRRDREAAIGRTWPLLIAGCLAASGCTHVTHAADVEPGLSVSLMGGAGVEHWRDATGPGATEARPERAFTGAWDAALSVGYGWRFTEDLALSTTVIAPIGHRSDHEATPVYTNLAVDNYLQLNHGVVDLGVGIQLGNALGLYGEAGHGWSLPGGASIRLDGGLRLAKVAGSLTDFSTALIPFALVSVRGETFHAGLWADAWIMAPPFDRCDECVGYRVDVALMGGAVVGFRHDFGGTRPAETWDVSAPRVR